MVRAKFKCDVITERSVGPTDVQHDIELSLVYQGDDSEHENAKFWKYTPAGKIQMSCLHPDAVKQFAVGKSYYIDFSPAEN